MLQSIERFLKQAIVDKNPSVSSAAIVSSLALYSSNHASRDVIKRWVNQVQEAINSKGVITQYHALGLVYLMKQHDRMSVSKLVQAYAKTGLRSVFAQCMLVRYCCSVYEDVVATEGEERLVILALDVHDSKYLLVKLHIRCTPCSKLGFVTNPTWLFMKQQRLSALSPIQTPNNFSQPSALSNSCS